MQQMYYKQQQIANVDCKQFDETVKHIISAGPILGKEQDIQRHDTVCVGLHCNICREIGGNETVNTVVAMYQKWYKQVMKVWQPYCGMNSAN